MSLFLKVINDHVYDEETDDAYPYCNEHEIPKLMYKVVKNLDIEQLYALSRLLTNPIKAQAQLKFWIDDKTYNPNVFLYRYMKINELEW